MVQAGLFRLGQRSASGMQGLFNKKVLNEKNDQSTERRMAEVIPHQLLNLKLAKCD